MTVYYFGNMADRIRYDERVAAYAEYVFDAGLGDLTLSQVTEASWENFAQDLASLTEDERYDAHLTDGEIYVDDLKEAKARFFYAFPRQLEAEREWRASSS